LQVNVSFSVLPHASYNTLAQPPLSMHMWHCIVSGCGR
jgi:hypothetical protein